MEILFLFDGGAYSDKAIDVSRAAAVDCTGPYHVENVFCDSLCVYTFDNEQRVLKTIKNHTHLHNKQEER